MKIVVDTNVVFSALVNPGSTITDLIFNYNERFIFYSPETMHVELERHRKKLIEVSQITEGEKDELLYLLGRKIEIIHLDYLSPQSWKRALQYVQRIDEFDAPFLALTIELSGILWTGDKKLVNGLIRQGFEDVVSTHDLVKNSKN